VPSNSNNRIPKSGDLQLQIRAVKNSNTRQWRIPTNVHARMKSFNSKKQFTVFKTINHFSKIEEAFSVKLKMVFIYHHFRLHQTPKNILRQMISLELFYSRPLNLHLLCLVCVVNIIFCCVLVFCLIFRS
jgi:hypothetical protein